MTRLKMIHLFHNSWYNGGRLLIHKEKDMTSHDVVNKLRRILHTKKIGHSGTLDPQATGVLLVLIGKACKVLPYLEDTDKEYIAKLQLGKKTLSDDIWGEVLDEKPIQEIENFSEVLQHFQGKIKQVPPMISSVRVNGKKLYEYARNHIEVQRPIREVEIYEIEVLDEKELTFRVACSSGTYIRSLCHDIGEMTNNYGCMASLIRTKVGRFSLTDCVTLEDVEKGNFTLMPTKLVLAHYPMVAYPNIKEVYQGKKITLDCIEDEVVILDQDQVVAIYAREKGKVFRCLRGLW